MATISLDIQLSNPAAPQIQYEGRTCYTGAIVIGDTLLMGAIPLEDMDLILLPAERKVVVNPKSPNIPSAIVK